MSSIHTTTIWCALLAKVHKGLLRCMPPKTSLLQYRILLQLSLEETSHASCNRLAFALVARPADVASALAALKTAGFVENGPGAAAPDAAALGAAAPDAASPSAAPSPAAAGTNASPGAPPSSATAAPLEKSGDTFSLTDAGRALQCEISVAVQRFFDNGHALLPLEDRERMQETLRHNLCLPGSFFVRREASLRHCAKMPLPYLITAYLMMWQTIDGAAKRNTGLSLTDYRFLAELYPKRRGTTKQLRAKDLVALLRVGRAYVSTSSTRLEESGCIRRIPDPDDARGVLFEITATGRQMVQDTDEDLSTVYAGLYTVHHDGSEHDVRMLKDLLRGFDREVAR